MPPEDIETEDLSIRDVPSEEANPETNYDLPDFDDIETDTSNVNIDVTVPAPEEDIEEKTTKESEQTTIAEEAANFDIDAPREPIEPVVHQSILTEDLPDFGEVDLTTDDEDIDLPDFDDLPPPPKSTTDAIIKEIPDFQSPWQTSTETETKSSSIPSFDLPDFDDSPALRDDSSFQISSSTDDDSAFGDDFFDDADTNYKKEKDREKFEAETEQGKGKNKRYALICLICTILCLIIFGLFLFIFPTKLNLFRKNTQTQVATYTDKVTTTTNTETVSTDSSSSSTSTSTDSTSTSATKSEAVAPVTTVETTTNNTDNTINSSTSKDESQSKKPVQTEAITGKEDTIVVATTPSVVVPTRPEKSGNVPADIRYQVVWGDTLWDISNAYYKNPWRYPRIAEYNSIKNPDFIRSGQILLIPAE
ncbi:MAG: LysM peptidoglycan-binding domain-containing protein [Treponema sp.]|nr:LysM peptidoglycan-binding domain-containing protein [Treponema sp.]